MYTRIEVERFRK